MDINVSTPSILFPAISLLLLAFTNRFLALANLIRQLHDQYKLKPEPAVLAQMAHLQQRLLLIRNMQAYGVTSLVMCIACIGMVLLGQPTLALLSFVISLLLMLASLVLSLREILISYRALAMHLADIEELHRDDDVAHNRFRRR